MLMSYSEVIQVGNGDGSGLRDVKVSVHETIMKAICSGRCASYPVHLFNWSGVTEDQLKRLPDPHIRV